MNEDEMRNALKLIKFDYRRLFEEHNKAVRLLLDKAIQLSKTYHGIEVGDKIIVRGEPAIIRKISNPYFSINPEIRVSFLKKDGTPRADTNQVWETWEKAND